MFEGVCTGVPANEPILWSRRSYFGPAVIDFKTPGKGFDVETRPDTKTQRGNSNSRETLRLVRDAAHELLHY